MGAIVCWAIIIGYPTLGLKMPQKDNPIQYRKKYGTTGSIQQMQQFAMMEYGGKVEKFVDSNVVMGPNGFQFVGSGLRIDLDSYRDFIC